MKQIFAEGQGYFQPDQTHVLHAVPFFFFFARLAISRSLGLSPVQSDIGKK